MNQMLASMDKINFSFKTSKFTPKSLSLKPFNSHMVSCSPLQANLKMVESNSKLKLSASAANSILSEEGAPKNKEKLRVVVKPMEKPRIVLKMIWMEKAIGVALDQVIPGFGTIPLTPYYFWRKEDVQEQLKVLLESKPWISHKQTHILLNQATPILNSY